VRFGLSALTSGVVLLLALTMDQGDGATLLVFAIVAIAAKLAFELADLRRPDGSATLLRGPLRETLVRRFELAALSACCFVVSPLVPGLAWFAAVLWLIGEGLERHLFFRAGVSPRMP
jgi:hypothetical protein